MAKALLYRLLGIGKIPKELASMLEREDVKVCDEGVCGSVTYRNFKSEFSNCNWRKQRYISSIALTGTRLVGLRGSRFIVNTPLTDPRLCKVAFSVEKDEVFTMKFDASLFQKNWSGEIEYRFKTEHANALLTNLLSIQKKIEQESSQPLAGS